MKASYEGPCFCSSIKLENMIDDIESMFPLEYIPEYVIEIIKKLLLTLANEYEILHNDVHAGNIMVDDKGVLKLIDFELVNFI